MSSSTAIQWTEATWNPVRGCSRVSEGCRNCYAERVASRFSGAGKPFEGFATRTQLGKPRWTGKVALIPELLTLPLRWRKPRRVFVNSMSDLFHESLHDDDIDSVFAVMGAARQHTFQVLTKRPGRMLEYLSASDRLESIYAEWTGVHAGPVEVAGWPLPNVWLGTSVEDQATANERIPQLVQTPAAVRFISAEPLLGPVRLRDASKGWLDLTLGPEPHERPSRDTEPLELPQRPPLDWVIVGGESGPDARPCDVAWIRSIVRQCQSAGVACFVKQLGRRPVDQALLPDWKWTDASQAGWAGRGITEYPDGSLGPWLTDSHGGDPAEWPEDLRVREFPASPEAVA